MAKYPMSVMRALEIAAAMHQTVRGRLPETFYISLDELAELACELGHEDRMPTSYYGITLSLSPTHRLDDIRQTKFRRVMLYDREKGQDG